MDSNNGQYKVSPRGQALVVGVFVVAMVLGVCATLLLVLVIQNIR